MVPGFLQKCLNQFLTTSLLGEGQAPGTSTKPLCLLICGFMIRISNSKANVKIWVRTMKGESVSRAWSCPLEHIHPFGAHISLVGADCPLLLSSQAHGVFLPCVGGGLWSGGVHRDPCWHPPPSIGKELLALKLHRILISVWMTKGCGMAKKREKAPHVLTQKGYRCICAY